MTSSFVFKIQEKKKGRYVVQVFSPPVAEFKGMVLTEARLCEIQDWCKENECGKRTAFNLFEFKTKGELTMFLLKWS